MTREPSENTDKVTATQKRLVYLLSRPQSISSIFEVPCSNPLFVFAVSPVASAETPVWGTILTKRDDLVEQSASLPKSQTEVCLIFGVAVRMRLQTTIGAVGRTVGAEEVEKP